MRLPPLLFAVLVYFLAAEAIVCHASRHFWQSLSVHVHTHEVSKVEKRVVCDDPKFRRNSLKLVKEMPAVGLFPDLKGHSKFEISGIEIADGSFWVIFDSSYSFGKVDLNFGFGGKDNELLGEVGDESDFEDLTYVPSRGTFLAHREGVQSEGGGEISTLELKVEKDKKDYKVVRSCNIEFVPDPRYPNKGFEGIHYFEMNGTEYLMALCEGNYCTGGKTGRQPGNGRLVLATFYEDEQGCQWKTLKVLEVPSKAYFEDYSGINFRGDKVGIVSQESSAVWIGQFDFEALDFVGEGETYTFPRDDECNFVYCNMEGIAFIDDTRIVVGSDRAKTDQPYSCTLKDQSVHVFALPSSKEDQQDYDDDGVNESE